MIIVGGNIIKPEEAKPCQADRNAKTSLSEVTSEIVTSTMTYNTLVGPIKIDLVEREAICQQLALSKTRGNHSYITQTEWSENDVITRMSLATSQGEISLGSVLNQHEQIVTGTRKIGRTKAVAADVAEKVAKSGASIAYYGSVPHSSLVDLAIVGVTAATVKDPRLVGKAPTTQSFIAKGAQKLVSRLFGKSAEELAVKHKIDKMIPAERISTKE